MNLNDSRLDWIRQYSDGQADAETTQRLQEALREDDELRNFFIEYLNVDLGLTSHFVLSEASPAKFTWGSKLVWSSLAAAAAVLLLLAGLWIPRGLEVEMLRAVGKDHSSLPHGEWVGKSIAFSEGCVELSFRRAKASVVIEAPARFSIEDPTTLKIEQGRVVAHVRDGMKGLRVLTPHTDVLDLGTRFAVDVSDSGRSEVHVFEGKVEAGRLGEGKRDLLTTNQALRFANSEQPEAREIRDGTFIQPEEMKALADGQLAGQAIRATKAETELRRDPALIGFFSFEEEDIQSGLSVHGANRVQGRFPGQFAIEFVDHDDHARIDLEAVTPELTLMAWVRLDRLPRGGISSLYHTDTWELPGQVHWMIVNNGLMRFALHKTPTPDKPQAKAVWGQSGVRLAEALQRWTHLASTYDSTKRTVTFFRDGRLESQSKLMFDAPARLSSAQIGNWAQSQNQNSANRRLSGRVDEFVMLSRVLSPEEIRDYFESGNPYK
jgi:hypothetical protein